jgi:hypothetical protein
MKHVAKLATLAALGLAGCATSSDPGALAARECGYFARVEGARVVDVESVDAVSDGFKVRMKVEDGLSRRTSAECLYASNKASWVSPLPNGFQKI